MGDEARAGGGAARVAGCGLPLVTVMIPTYNQADFLAEAIASALAQDYPRLEVVVSDDASTDATPDVVARFQDSRLRSHRNPRNLGRVGNYRQLLGNLARGDWVINLDGDDCFLDPGFVSRAMALARTDPAVVLVFARVLKGESAKSGEVLNSDPGLPPTMDGTRFFTLHPPFGRVAPMHGACLYLRQPALALGFYRKDILSSDFESIYRLMLGNRVGFVPTTATLWRQHGANASGTSAYAPLLANVAVFEGPFRHAIDIGAIPPREADAWLDRRLARYLLSALKRALAGGLPLAHAARLALDLVRRRPRLVLGLPAALRLVLAERPGRGA